MTSAASLTLLEHNRIALLSKGDSAVIHAHIVHRSTEDEMPAGVRITLDARAIGRCLQFAELAQRAGIFTITVSELEGATVDWDDQREAVERDIGTTARPKDFDKVFLKHYDDAEIDVFHVEATQFCVNGYGELFVAGYEKHSGTRYEGAAIPMRCLPARMDVRSLSDEDLVGVLYANRPARDSPPGGVYSREGELLWDKGKVTSAGDV
jgi:hypothetical protein